MLAYAGVGWISEAMEMMLLSFVGPAVQSAWNLSSHQESFITSAVFAGMLIGAYTWGIVSDKHGRRYLASFSFSTTLLSHITLSKHIYVLGSIWIDLSGLICEDKYL